MRLPLPLFLAGCAAAIICSAGELCAQTNGSASTKDGVYTRDQAERGQQVFITLCKSCHTPESHTMPAFVSKWEGKLLSELFQYIRDEMPKNEPGSLAIEEYADVLAYILRLNGMPAGADELPADANQMKSVRVQIMSSRPKAVRKDP